MSDREKATIGVPIDEKTVRELETVRTDHSGEIDLEQFEYRMSLSPLERLQANDRLARFAAMLKQGGQQYGERLV